MSNNKTEKTGGDVNYYVVPIPDPKRHAPYVAECEDIIEALGMTFSEGNEFKAIWRSCAARTLGVLKADMDEDGIYDAEKQQYYASRTLAVRKRNRDKRIKKAEDVIETHIVVQPIHEHIDSLPIETNNDNNILTEEQKNKLKEDSFLTKTECNALLYGLNGDGTVREYYQNKTVDLVIENARIGVENNVDNVAKCRTQLFTVQEKETFHMFMDAHINKTITPYVSFEEKFSVTALQKAAVMGLHGTDQQKEEAREFLKEFLKPM